MNPARSLSITAYRWGTLPYRKWRLQRNIGCSSVPISILFYHRVADHSPTPWTIDRRQFEQQIHWLRRHFDLISLAEVQRRMAAGNRRPAVCITFDDGYEDNVDFALPLLASLNIPTMYFVSQGFLDSDQAFPHDGKLGLHLQPNQSSSLRRWVGSCIQFGGHTRNHVDLGQITNLDLLYDEIVVANRDLEAQLGTKIEHFAFPFGQPAHLSVAACELARQCGLKSVSSAYGGWNRIGNSSFHLQRMHGDPHLGRLKNWLTGDPRTLRVGPIEAAQSAASRSEIAAYLAQRPAPSSVATRVPVPDLSLAEEAARPTPLRAARN